jgi:hypothetical protein
MSERFHPGLRSRHERRSSPEARAARLHTPGKLEIEGIAQAITDQIDGQHGHSHKQAGEEKNPEGQLDVGSAFSHDIPQLGIFGGVPAPKKLR